MPNHLKTIIPLFIVLLLSPIGISLAQTPSPPPTPIPSTTTTPEGCLTPSPPPLHIYVPDDYATIQLAIDVAVDGDEIIVRDGTYIGEGNRDIEFRGKAISLSSENGPENTIIDCEREGRGFSFQSGETLTTILSGFTITGGSVDYGGGIIIRDSSPLITECIISRNWARKHGAGVCLYNSNSTVITDCSISNNGGGYTFQGGGVYIGDGSSSVVINNCTISNNGSSSDSAVKGGGIYVGNSSTALIKQSTISDNVLF